MSSLSTTVETGRPMFSAGRRAIYHPKAGEKMKVVFFTSTGGNNLLVAVGMTRVAEPGFEIGCIVCDREAAPARKMSEELRIPLVVRDFNASCGFPATADAEGRQAYEEKRERLHTEILMEIGVIEQATGRQFDLAVLAYRRIITGPLLERFRDRMINQHPGDLSVRGAQGRTLVGKDPIMRAFRLGHSATCTTTHIVTEGMDAGEILCQGPDLRREPSENARADCERHEQLQKLRSDAPSLRFALSGIACGRFEIGDTPFHADGLRQIFYDGTPLPYNGAKGYTYA